MNAVAQLVGVTKSYQRGSAPVVHALRGVDLTFPSGDYAAILGPSGSGKSTLMNILGCLDQPTTGRYLLDGREVEHLHDRELSRERGRRLGFVFQSFHLIPAMTVRQNIETPLMYQRVSPPLRRERAERAAAMVGLSDRLDHKPTELSGGQQQRVAIARALVAQPKLLLADEPTGNLDSATGQSILALFDDLHTKGLTIVLVTHDEQVARRCHRRIWMRDGRVESDEANH